MGVDAETIRWSVEPPELVDVELFEVEVATTSVPPTADLVTTFSS